MKVMDKILEEVLTHREATTNLINLDSRRREENPTTLEVPHIREMSLEETEVSFNREGREAFLVIRKRKTLVDLVSLMGKRNSQTTMAPVKKEEVEAISQIGSSTEMTLIS